MNEYEPSNSLQKLWESTEGGCLCTMRESCSNCDVSKTQTKKQILQTAKDLNYQLYLLSWTERERKPIDYEYVTKTFDLN